jgi:hypothetical protein
MNPALDQLGHKNFQLAIPDQRVTAHKRKVQRPKAIDALQHTVDEVLSGAIR